MTALDELLNRSLYEAHTKDLIIREMQEALNKISEDKWAINTQMKHYDCSIASIASNALIEVEKIAKEALK